MYTPNEIRPTPVQECHRRMQDGPTSFTRAQSVQGNLGPDLELLLTVETGPDHPMGTLHDLYQDLRGLS